MTALTREVPLLPLSTVLFPGTLLPIQISHDASRALLRDCAAADHPFGVVLCAESANLTRPSVPATTGCMASVALVLHDEEDSYNAILYGEHRMRVIEYNQQSPYPTGQVVMLDDFSGLHADRKMKQATEVFQQYLDLIRQRYQVDVVDLTLSNDPTTASYLLASLLHLPLDIKQQWLESASTAARLGEELVFLRAECEKHATFLALSQQTQHQYSMPDFEFYTRLVSQN
ncbi:MAG: LON peptidase substrate-binding domain-containing protein [Armatimonadota bacterium]